MSMLGHTSLHFIVLSFVFACACTYVVSEDQTPGMKVSFTNKLHTEKIKE